MPRPIGTPPIIPPLGFEEYNEPLAPINLSATPISATQINLTWSDVSLDETSFVVYKSTDGITYSLVTSLAPNTTSYSVTGLSPNTLYYFKVYAVRGASSAPSNVASATTTPYYIYDQFTTNDAAPINSPRTCEPGPGTLVVTDTGNKTSISGGEAIVALPGVALGNPGIWGGSLLNNAGGLAIGLKLKFSSGHPNLRLGWSQLQSGGALYGFETSAGSGGDLGIIINTTGVLVEILSNVALGTGYHNWWVIQRTGGGFYAIIDNRIFIVSKALWAASAYPAIVCRGVQASNGWVEDTHTVAQLADSAWAGTYPSALTELVQSGGSLASTNYNHEAEFCAEFDTGTSPTFSLYFRYVDNNNYWTLNSVAGAASIVEIVAGVPTVRGTATLSNNSHYLFAIAKNSLLLTLETNTGVTLAILYRGTYTPLAATGVPWTYTGGLNAIAVWKSTVPSSALTELTTVMG